MDVKIRVVRRRFSVTQGAADVFINEKKVISFDDKIVMLRPGEVYFGEKIGEWASVTPDTQFIISALYHSLDHIYKYSADIKKALGEIKAQEIANKRSTES